MSRDVSWFSLTWAEEISTTGWSGFVVGYQVSAIEPIFLMVERREEFMNTQLILPKPPIQSAVLHALHQWQADPYHALKEITPAIEASACKYLGKSSTTAGDFKKFFREHMEIFKVFCRFPENPDFIFEGETFVTDRGKEIPNPDMADIVYHAYRCALQHGKAVEENFLFTRTIAEGLGVARIHDGKIQLPAAVVIGLVGVVVLCPANFDQKTVSSCYLEFPLANRHAGNPYRLDIDLWWGRGEDLREFSDRVMTMQGQGRIFPGSTVMLERLE